MDREFLRGISIYRPYPDAVPYAMLEPGYSAGQFDDVIERLSEPARALDSHGSLRIQELNYLRVARHSERKPEEAVGTYVARATTHTSFVLEHLLIEPHFRGRGLGRWLMGHAIGLTESKGGRELRVLNQPECEFLKRYGFTQTGDTGVDWCLTFSPE